LFLFKRNGIYQVQYFDEAENRVKRVSTKSKIKSDALKFLSEFKKNLTKNEKVEYINLEEFRKIYLEYANTAFSKSYIKRGIEYSFNTILKDIDVKTPLLRLHTNQLEKVLLAHYQKSKTGAHSIYRTLKSAFQKAIQWKYLTENPFKSIKLPKVNKNHPLFITLEDLKKILTNECNPDFKELYSFAFYTGMRLNEIINLKWDCIDFNSNKISVKNTDGFTTKSKLERIIPVNKTLFKLLSDRKEIALSDKNDFVFKKSRGVKLNPDTVSRNFKRAVIKSELNTKIHFHTLRHSFASNLIINGVSLYIVKELLGHQDYSTTQIYSHLSSNSLEDAVNKL
jgi:site-specific recombinase XerD